MRYYEWVGINKNEYIIYKTLRGYKAEFYLSFNCKVLKESFE